MFIYYMFASQNITSIILQARKFQSQPLKSRSTGRKVQRGINRDLTPGSGIAPG